MFLISVIAFVVGIYIQALYSIPLAISFAACALLLCFIPFALRRADNTATICILICFIFAGIARLGIITESLSSVHFDDEVRVYEGLIIEASPNTKIIQLNSPEDTRGLRVILRTEENLNISDTIKIFGNLKELTLAFKNPSIISWKWLKRLEGISYEVKGKIVSVTKGKNTSRSGESSLLKRLIVQAQNIPASSRLLPSATLPVLAKKQRRFFYEPGHPTYWPYQDQILASLQHSFSL